MRLTVKMKSLIQNLRLEMLLVLALTTSAEMVSASQSAGPVTSKRIVTLEMMRIPSSVPRRVSAISTLVALDNVFLTGGFVTEEWTVMMDLMRMRVDRRGMVQTPASMRKDGSRCLLADHVCDKISQCEDGSDEGSFCSQKPDCSSLTCSHKCILTPAGPSCYCQPGYTLGPDKTSCVDVDECQEFGSCSQGCQNTVGSFACSCVEGYVLQNNSCLAVRGEPLLFFSTKSKVRGLKVKSMEYFPVATNLPYVIGVGFDSTGGRVYWTDVEAGKETLVSAGLDGSGSTELVTNGLDMPEDLVVDEINRNIYFTDSVRKHLAVCSIDGNGCSVLISDFEQPRAVAIHHKKRLVMFTDWGSKPAIVQVAMHGTNKKDLVTEDLVWPNGLAVDEVDDRIYWSDAKKDTVERIHMDGTDRRVILDMVAKRPFSMAVFEDSLYWSDWEMQEIVSCNKFSGKNFKTLVKEAGIRPMGITIAHPLLSHTGPPSPCQASPCSHVCLPHPLLSHTGPPSP